MNAAFASTAPADVVIVNSDTVVPAAWLERLRAAAYSDELVATASTLTNHGTILSVPERNIDRRRCRRPGSRSPRPTRGSRAPRRGCTRASRPASGTASTSAASALELVGDFDEAFSPGYGEEVDFCQRCLARGLRHVVADDLYVFHRGGGVVRRRAQRAPARQRGRAQPPLPLLREAVLRGRDVGDASRWRARWPPRGSRSASCR